MSDPRIDPEEVDRARRERAAELEPTSIKPIRLDDLVREYPKLRAPIVDGLLRQGETANIIASPKVGKSFLAGNLACCIASGRPWFDHDVHQGKVLILDNELHPETLAHRLDRIANDMQLADGDRQNIEAIHLRGQVLDLINFGPRLEIEPGFYSLVVLDALYRTIPAGTSENDNAAMMAIYNQLDHYAAKWGAAIVVVHHSSKGAQGEKSVTDVGSGAGSISRAADTHIVIRPHETEGLCVMEAVTRSFKSPEPLSIKFSWPIWNAVTVAPEVKKQGQKKAKDNPQDLEAVLAKIPCKPKWIQRKDLAAQFPYGPEKLNKIVGGFIKDGKVVRRNKKVGKRDCVYFSRSGSGSEETPELQKQNY